MEAAQSTQEPGNDNLDETLGDTGTAGETTAQGPEPETTPEVDATPAAQRLASENNLDIRFIEGTGGPDGDRVTIDDVELALAKRRAAAAETPIMEERDHLRGCPMGADRPRDPDNPSPNPPSVEIYDARQPRRAEDGTLIGYDVVKVAHCVDCGETRVAAAD